MLAGRQREWWAPAKATRVVCALALDDRRVDLRVSETLRTSDGQEIVCNVCSGRVRESLAMVRSEMAELAATASTGTGPNSDEQSRIDQRSGLSSRCYERDTHKLAMHDGF